MTKQYRDELRILDRAERKLRRDERRYARVLMKQAEAILHAVRRGKTATTRHLTRIAKRRAILQARIAS